MASEKVHDVSGHYNNGFPKAMQLLGHEELTAETVVEILMVAREWCTAQVDNKALGAIATLSVVEGKEAKTAMEALFDCHELAMALAEKVLGTKKIDLFQARLVAFQAVMGYPPGYTYTELKGFLGDEAEKYDWTGVDLTEQRSLPNWSKFGLTPAQKQVMPGLKTHLGELVNSTFEEGLNLDVELQMRGTALTAKDKVGRYVPLILRDLVVVLRIKESTQTLRKARKAGATKQAPKVYTPPQTQSSWTLGKAAGVARAGAGGP